MNPTPSNFSLDNVLRTLQRHVWLGGIIVACVLTTLLAFIHALPSLYQSSASIAVEARQISTEVVPTNHTMGAEGRVRILSQKILSRDRLNQLATQFSLYPELARKPGVSFELVDAIRGDIGLQVHGDGSEAAPNITFDVSFIGTSPETVQQIADALALFYIDENVKERKTQTAGTVEFLRTQLKETQAKLEVQERTLAEYKQRNIEELPEHLDSNLAQLDLLRGELSATSTSLAAAQQRKDIIGRRLQSMTNRAGSESPSSSSKSNATSASGKNTKGNPSDATLDPAMSMAVTVHTQLGVLRTRLEGLKVHFSDKHPDVVQTRKEIAALEEKIKTLPPVPALPKFSSSVAEEGDGASSTALHPSHIISIAAESARRATELASLQAEHTTLEAEIGRRTLEIGRLKKEIAAYQARVERTPQRDQELQKLTRDYTTAHELYLSLLKRLDETMLASSLEESPQAEKFQVLEPARIPEDPIGPRRKLLSVAALIASLGFAFVIILARELMTPVFHSIEELRSFTTVEILGSVPRITTQKEWMRQRFRQGIGLVSLGIVLLTLATVAQSAATENIKVARALSRAGGMKAR